MVGCSPVDTIKTWKNHCGSLLDPVNGFDVVACRPCGFTHLFPVPLPADLERMYRDEYYSKQKPDHIAEIREDSDWWNLIYRERYELLEGYLTDDRRRILDVGSGPGYFLLHGKSRGWAGLGLEPSADAALPFTWIRCKGFSAPTKRASSGGLTSCK